MTLTETCERLYHRAFTKFSLETYVYTRHVKDKLFDRDGEMFYKECLHSDGPSLAGDRRDNRSG